VGQQKDTSALLVSAVLDSDGVDLPMLIAPLDVNHFMDNAVPHHPALLEQFRLIILAEERAVRFAPHRSVAPNMDGVDQQRSTVQLLLAVNLSLVYAHESRFLMMTAK